jgi:hypothetical protein
MLSCSPLFEGGESSSDHPHFAYEEAYFYHWAPGTPGPAGTDYIFRFVPREGKEPEFGTVRLGEEKEEPDISRKGDTIRLMLQRSGQGGLPGGKGAEEEEEERTPRPKSATIEYRLEGEQHRYRVERIKERDKKTRYQ